jgi:hypothetical protein
MSLEIVLRWKNRTKYLDLNLVKIVYWRLFHKTINRSNVFCYCRSEYLEKIKPQKKENLDIESILEEYYGKKSEDKN